MTLPGKRQRHRAGEREEESPDIHLHRLAFYSAFFLMGLWGCLSIYNATPFAEHSLHFASKQLIWLFLGLALAVASARVPFEWYENNIVAITIAAYASLLLLFPFGVELNGMKGWYNLKYCMAQPSELVKPVFVLSMCVLARRWNSPNNLFPILAAATLIWIFPLAAQPDFGTMSIYLAGFVVVYLLANGKYTHLAITVPILALAAVAIYIKEPYVADRINAFFAPAHSAPSDVWHWRQITRTLAGGGLTGTDWGDAIWSNNYLPLAYSDSAFASLAETVGFVGTIPVILAFCAVAYAGHRVSRGIENETRGMFIRAISLIIATQAFLHMSVNVGLLPPTGVTLPMISYGGSSMISTALCLGMALSAARHPARDPRSNRQLVE